MKVTKRELEEWYNSMGIKELAAKLGYDSTNSVYYLLKKAGIPLKGSERLRRRNVVKLVMEE